MWSRSTLASVKDAADIVKVVESRGVSLKRSGAGEVGLCPFHDENTPSFHVNPMMKTFHCFGCGQGGDAIDFVREFDGSDFADAVRSLAAQFGVILPDDEDADADADVLSRKEMFAITADAASVFADAFNGLDDNHPAMKTIVERGVFGMDTFGFGSEEALAHLDSTWGKSALSTLGFLSARGNHLFRNRLIFPIRDIMGRPVGFSARSVFPSDNLAKYMNTSASPIYDKSKSFYGIDRARKARSRNVILVEGQMDVCSLRACGVDAVVATCGTAVTQNHVDILLRRFERITFFLDGDAAGRKAAVKVLSLKGVGLHGDAVNNMSGKDPNEILLSSGPVALKKMVEEGTHPLVDVVLSPLLPEGVDPTEDARNADAMNDIIENIADDAVKVSWRRFLRRGAVGNDPTPVEDGRGRERGRGGDIVDGGDLLAFVANNPKLFFDAVRSHSTEFENAIAEDVLPPSSVVFINGALYDDDFVEKVWEYVPDEDGTKSHASNALWAFLDEDAAFKLVKSSTGMK